MKILLKRVWLDTESPLRQKGSVGGEIVFDKGLKLEFDEDLLPEELEYIKDGLADLTSRVRERVKSVIMSEQERDDKLEKKAS